MPLSAEVVNNTASFSLKKNIDANKVLPFEALLESQHISPIKKSAKKKNLKPKIKCLKKSLLGILKKTKKTQFELKKAATRKKLASEQVKLSQLTIFDLIYTVQKIEIDCKGTNIMYLSILFSHFSCVLRTRQQPKGKLQVRLKPYEI